MKIEVILIICYFYLINSQLSIIGPSDLSSLYSNKPIDIVFRKMTDTSNFYVHGEVFFENVTKEHEACKDLGILQSKTGQNQYSENFKILFAYIGSCSILQKARNAQSAGASMLVLINNNAMDIKDVLLEEDASENDIKIPIGLISQYNGRTMENYIEKNPKNKIMIEINFKFTEPKKKVQLKFFFSSSELKAYELINNLTTYIDKYDDQVEFIPIYVTHQIPSYDPNNAKREFNCVTKGKYCYFPKETTITQDSRAILMESLRQKCMYFKSIESKKMKYYYDYMDDFHKNCLLMHTPRFNDRCAKQNLDSRGFAIDYLDDCIANSFGVNNLLSSSYVDNENSIFKSDYEEILKYKLSSFPAVVVDDKPIIGIIRENKIANALCEAVKTKPSFCNFIAGAVIGNNTRRKWSYFLIFVIVIINISLFIIFRKYIKKQIGEKINFNMIEVDGRVNNILTNFFQFRKQEGDYQSFDKNGQGPSKTGMQIEGTVNTI